MNLASRLLKHTVVRNAALLYAVQFSGYVLPLITLPYLSRVLSTEMFGVIAFAQSFIWYFVALTEYGFNLTATRAVAVARESPGEINRIFSAVITAKALLTVAGFIVLSVVAALVPMLRAHWRLYLLMYLMVLANLLFPVWLFQGMQKMQHVAVRDLASKLLSLAALFAFVHSDRDYLIAAAAQPAGLLVSGIAGLFSARRRLGVQYHRPPWADIKIHMKIGWPAFVSLAISTFAGVTNMFVMGLLAPATEVAYYSAIQRIISALRALVSPISTAVYPHASQKAVGSERDVVEFVRKYQLLFAAPFLAAGVVLAVAAPWLVPVLLGAKYAPAIIVLQITAFVPALSCLSQVYSTYFMLACGYDKQWMRIVLATVAINFIVLIVSLYLMRGSVALGVTALLTEGGGALLYWRFYRGKARRPAAAAKTI